MFNRNEINAAFGPEKILFVTPATPGFYVLSPCYDEDGAICEASREPVIAWALSESGCSYPLAMNDSLNQRGDPAILCPDGEVRSYDSGWLSEADWLEEQKAKVRHVKLR